MLGGLPTLERPLSTSLAPTANLGVTLGSEQTVAPAYYRYTEDAQKLQVLELCMLSLSEAVAEARELGDPIPSPRAIERAKLLAIRLIDASVAVSIQRRVQAPTFVTATDPNGRIEIVCKLKGEPGRMAVFVESDGAYANLIVVNAAGDTQAIRCNF